MIKILIILCSLFIAIPLYANPCMQMVMGGTTGTTEPPAACDTQAAPTDMVTYDATSVAFIASTSALKYVSSVFTAGETADICQVCIYVKNSTGGTTNFSITPYIYSNNTTPTPDEPGSVISNGTFETKDMATILNGTYQWLCFNPSGTAPSLTNGTIYHFVLVASSTDGTDIMYAGKDATCGDQGDEDEYMFRSSDGATWTPLDTDRCMMLKLMKAGS